MKKIFLIFSSAVIMLLLTFSLIQNKDIIAFLNYAGIDVLGQKANKPPIHRDKFNLELNKFAQENNIVLAQRIVEPNKTGKTEFKYAIFGKGELPQGLKKASTNTLKFSDITGSYLIVKGQVNPNILKSKFADLGYIAVPDVKTSLIRSLLMLLNETSVLCIFIFLLTFAGLSLIYRIKDLRFAGIRLISGESLATV
ncbi:MAG: bacteriocin-associated integral membrane family protein, partial [Lactobacillaceae bacterium]